MKGDVSDGQGTKRRFTSNALAKMRWLVKRLPRGSVLTLSRSRPFNLGSTTENPLRDLAW
jgi:hypothetical protein